MPSPFAAPGLLDSPALPGTRSGSRPRAARASLTDAAGEGEDALGSARARALAAGVTGGGGGGGSFTGRLRRAFSFTRAGQGGAGGAAAAAARGAGGAGGNAIASPRSPRLIAGGTPLAAPPPPPPERARAWLAHPAAAAHLVQLSAFLGYGFFNDAEQAAFAAQASVGRGRGWL
jgi:hypothetical protein